MRTGDEELYYLTIDKEERNNVSNDSLKQLTMMQTALQSFNALSNAGLVTFLPLSSLTVQVAIVFLLVDLFFRLPIFLKTTLIVF